MMKRNTFFLIILSFTLSAQAQFDTSFIKSNIKKCADSLTDAFRGHDWQKFTRYSNPALIGRMGGQKEFISFVSGMFSQIPDSAWKKYETGKILQVVKTGGDYQAVMELNTVLRWEFNLIKTTSYLVAQSWDGGMFWTFFDSQGDASVSKMIKPDLDERLIIPERKEVKVPLKH